MQIIVNSREWYKRNLKTGRKRRSMVRDTVENIKNQIDVRQNLIKLKAELKEGHNRTALM